ncbi:MAG: cyclic nucleotide-binding domain-containing protein [Deltaproteobacteria bacterium]|nr:cyclic nucleotide-binding domain-containing protein [Deltaproteobacteria bacterium]
MNGYKTIKDAGTERRNRYLASIEQLKRIRLFENLADGMLEKMLPLAQEQSFADREIIYEPGSEASHFYSLTTGKVLLQTELASALIISLGAIKPGYSFGWSALLPGPAHTALAVCMEPCEVLVMPGDEFKALLDQDHTMGFLVMQKTATILENRLERRTAQFVKVITKHSDIATLLGL